MHAAAEIGAEDAAARGIEVFTGEIEWDVGAAGPRDARGAYDVVTRSLTPEV